MPRKGKMPPQFKKNAAKKKAGGKKGGGKKVPAFLAKKLGKKKR